MAKGKRIMVWLPDCLARKVSDLSDEYGYSVSGLVRILVRDAFKCRKGVPRAVGIIMRDPVIYVSRLGRRVSRRYLRVPWWYQGDDDSGSGSGPSRNG